MANAIESKQGGDGSQQDGGPASVYELGADLDKQFLDGEISRSEALTRFCAGTAIVGDPQSGRGEIVLASSTQ